MGAGIEKAQSEFQTLIGTVKGLGRELIGNFLLAFQTLIGTVKGSSFGGVITGRDTFQTLIGTVKGRPTACGACTAARRFKPS